MSGVILGRPGRLDSHKWLMTWVNAGAPLSLSRSFRFGPAIAEEANRWLTIAQAPIRLTDTDTIPSEVGEVTEPEVMLCRPTSAPW
jgi:hypothetical protein